MEETKVVDRTKTQIKGRWNYVLGMFKEILKARTHTGGGDGDADRDEDNDNDEDDNEDNKKEKKPKVSTPQHALDKFQATEAFKRMDET